MQRSPQGKSPEQIEAGKWESRAWQREASRTDDSGLRPMWEATGWEGITNLVGTEGWAAYDVALDGQAQTWIAERDTRLAAEQE